MERGAHDPMNAKRMLLSGCYKFCLGAWFTTLIQISHPFEAVAQYSPPTNGLVGWWQGDGNANDSSGRGHNGTLLNGATFGTGLFGQAFSIGPGFNRVYVPDSTDFNITNSLSIGAWIYPTAESWHVLERGGNQSGSNPYGMGLDDAGHFEFYINNGTADLVMAPITFNQWIQVTATLDGTTGDMRLYFNGVVVAEKTTSLRPFALTNPSLQPALGIGNTPDVGGFPFIGLIEEVVLYSRALSPAEVAILATANTTVAPVITVEPQGHSVYSGTAVTLAVTASGSPPLNYLWYNDGLPMLSATNSSLSLVTLRFRTRGTMQ